MRVKINSLSKWQSKWAFETDAGKDAIEKLNQLIEMQGQLFEHVWKDIDEKEALQILFEIILLLVSFEDKKNYNTSD